MYQYGTYYPATDFWPTGSIRLSSLDTVSGYVYGTRNIIAYCGQGVVIASFHGYVKNTAEGYDQYTLDRQIYAYNQSAQTCSLDYDPLGNCGEYHQSYQSCLYAGVSLNTVPRSCVIPSNSVTAKTGFQYSTDGGRTWAKFNPPAGQIFNPYGFRVKTIGNGQAILITIPETDPNQANKLFLFDKGAFTEIPYHVGIMSNGKGEVNAVISGMAAGQAVISVWYSQAERPSTNTVTLTEDSMQMRIIMHSNDLFTITNEGLIETVTAVTPVYNKPDVLYTMASFEIMGKNKQQIKIEPPIPANAPDRVLTGLSITYTRSGLSRLVAMSGIGTGTVQFNHVGWDSAPSNPSTTYHASTFAGATIDPIYDMAYPYTAVQTGELALPAATLVDGYLTPATPYLQSITYSGGHPPVVFSDPAAGQLPWGLTISSVGLISGDLDSVKILEDMDTANEFTYNFTLVIQDYYATTAQQNFSIKVHR